MTSGACSLDGGVAPPFNSQLERASAEPPAAVEACVHHLIDARCEEQPELAAVCAWNGGFTYGQLIMLARLLGASLSARGVGPEVFVPIYFEKSRWMVVAMLGVLQAGGAFVLLDPSHPFQRLEAICKTLKAHLVVASSQNASQAAFLASNVVVVDEEIGPENRSVATTAVTRSKPSNAAYAMFTSGSTGAPKGAVIEHRSISSSTVAHGRRLNLSRTSRVLQFASYAFDICLLETLTVLVHGGCVCIPSEAERLGDLVGAMNRFRVNWASLTPSLTRSLNPKTLTTLETLVYIGEAMNKDDRDKWAQHVNLMNGYGPTECSVLACVHAFPKTADAPIRIGDPAGCSCWIVDENDVQSICAVGQIGELLIEGPIVGRGYMGDETKTATAFIDPPNWLQKLWPGVQSKLYKTGDLARCYPDGSIEYLGRKDSQLKVRGQRMESAEIEYHLRSHLSAMDVAVDVVQPKDDLESTLLTAFVVRQTKAPGDSQTGNPQVDLTVPDENFQILVQQAKSKMRQILPSSMIPTVFVTLSSMPLSTSGKLDRRSLRQLGGTKTRRELLKLGLEATVTTKPRNIKEKTMQQLWAEVLRLPNDCIELEDSFWSLGGNSIRAMKLAGIARGRGLILKAEDVLAAGTLEEMAAYASMNDFSTEEPPAFSLCNDESERTEVVRTLGNCQIKENEIEDIYPCTQLQAGLFSLAVKHLGAYTLCMEFELPVNVEIDRFQRAWQLTVEANPILRTRIVPGKDVALWQVVIRDVIPWETRGPSDDIPKQWRDWQPGKRLIRLAISHPTTPSTPRHFTLLIHHALTDGWALPLLLKQVEAAYRGEKLPPRPFSPFVRYLTSQDQSEIDRHWAESLSDLNAASFPKLPSPGYFPKPTATTKHTMPIAAASNIQQITVPTQLQLAWGLLLSQYTDSWDVVFGVTVVGRGAPVEGIESMTGPTIATIPMRLLLEPQETVIDTLKNIQAHSIRTMSVEQAGLQRISHLGADPAAATQFQSLLVIQADEGEHRRPPLFSKLRDLTQPADSSSYGISVIAKPSSNSVELEITYDPLMVTDVSMKRLIHQLEHIYQQIPQVPNSRIKDIEITSPSDVAELQEWNGQLPPRAEQCAHELIYQQILTQPEAPAVCAWDGEFTYRELETHAGNLAKRLMVMGVGPETFVPLYFEKSRWTTVAMLGVLKAGGAFAMLDPSHPMDRLQQICRETKGHIVISSESRAPFANQLGVSDIVILGPNHVELVNDVISGRSSAVTPSNAMYAVFTSGSTGKPKGAVITHGAWCTGAQANHPKMHLDRNSRVLQFAAYAFDMSVFDNLVTLVVGGCVCVPSDQDRMSNLAGAITALRANWATITPSVSRILSPEQCPTLKHIALGGEPMSRADVERWSPHLHLMNSYGPAECAVQVSLQQAVNTKQLTNIGTVNGAVGWVVDSRDTGRLCAVGAVGELLIEGPTIAREYLNNPQRTAEAFVENLPWLRAFRDAPSRLYKTGDLVQYTDDGELVLVGRKDTQIKLRGQRVELEEVEHHLRRCFPGAQGVVADVLPSQAGRASLLAGFVACTLGSKSSNLIMESDANFRKVAATALSQMSQAIPPYMVPAVLIPLSRLPLSATGKLNRRELRSQAALLSREQLDNFRMAEETTIRQPETDTQADIRRLFGEVLSIPEDQIGIQDDFFRRGGDSLSAMKLAALAEKSGYSLSVRDIFTSPQIVDLAGKTSRVNGTRSENVPPFSLIPDSTDQEQIISEQLVHSDVSRDQIEDIYPATPMQEGLMALTFKTPGKYVATFFYDLKEGIDLERFRAAVDSTVSANPILRTRLTQTSQGCFQVVVREEPYWEKYSAKQDYEDHSETIIMGPNVRLLRLSLITSPPRLVMDIHHALYDGWSLPLVWEQIEAAYREQSLQPRPFSPFIRHLQGQEGTASYWRSQLENLNAAVFPVLPYQTYEPMPSQAIHRRHSVRAGVQLDFTMSTAVQLAWAIIMSYYTDSSDVVFGLTLSGRSAAVSGIDQLTGPTVTTVPLRVRLDFDRSVQEEVHRIQQQLMDMTAHEQIGLREIRSLSSDAAKACQFQSHLGIQPPTKSSYGALATGFRSAHQDYGAFASYGFVLICHLAAEASEPLDIVAQYDREMLDAHQAQRMVMQFEHVLDQILSHPEKSLRSLSAISDHDWDQIRSWNTELPSTYERCLHDSVLDHRIRRPSAPAVCAWDGDLTFEDLASYSLGLVQLLRDNGLQSGSIVPVCLEKSKWCIITMMAVLRSGAALVCIDPKLPTERLRDILDQIKPHIAIGSKETKGKFEGLSAATILTVPVPVQVPRLSLTSAKEAWVDPKSPAFIVFTSGSTGRPKGIVMEHCNLSTSIRDHSDSLKIAQNSRVLHFASYAFDASIYEIFTTLVNGGCVCIPSESDRMNAIEQFIADKQVDVAILTPSMLAILDPNEVPSVRTVVSGGEALTRDVASRWASRVRLINGYGPAETTICAAGPVDSHWKPGTIGPMLGGLAWVTIPSDPQRLVPLGAIGELIIEGPVVTRGYLNRPDLTQAGYIDPPEWLTQWRNGKPGRVYRSGDLVELTTEGAIRFIGRKDTQVKLHGQRVELAEVEYHVRRCTGAQDAVVDIGTLEGSPVLFACIVQGLQHGPAGTGLFLPPTHSFHNSVQVAQESLRESVPLYMIPTLFLPVAEAPRTSGGKVDRRRLRDAVAALSSADRQIYTAGSRRKHREPSSAREASIHAVWALVLNKEPKAIGVDDSFFHLGGDSISAMRMISQLNRVGILTSVEEIFKQKTIANLAATATESGSGNLCSSDEAALGMPFRPSQIQQLFLDRNPTNFDRFSRGSLFELQRLVASEEVHQAVRWVIETHCMLRVRLSRDSDGEWHQRITTDIDTSYQYQSHHIISHAHTEDIFRAHQDALRVEHGPLVAVDLMYMDGGKQWLSIVAHGLVVDRVSWQIIVGHLEQVLDSKPISPKPGMLYPNWCRLMEERVGSHTGIVSQGTPSAMMDYWGLTETDNVYDDMEVYEISLDKEKSDLLLGPANEPIQTRPSELIQAGLLLAFSKTFPDRSIPVILNEDHSREGWGNKIDVSGTVGWLSSIYPCHVQVDASHDLVDIVRLVKDAQRDAEDRGRFSSPAQRGQKTEMEILFSYGGAQSTTKPGSLFKLAPVSSSQLLRRGSHTVPFAPIEILAEVTKDRLSVHFTYSKSMKKAGAIIQWAVQTYEALSILAQKLPTLPRYLTRSDFPFLHLTDEHFERFRTETINPFTRAGYAVEDSYSCSPIQHGMLLAQAKNPQEYINRVVWTVRGRERQPVDTDRLVHAWHKVVQKHPILRTVFVDSARGDGSMDQVVLDGFGTDIVQLSSTESDDPLEALPHHRDFLFPKMSPPHRLTVGRSATGAVACSWEVNHALVDGVTTAVIFHDLLQAYDGLLSLGIDRVYRAYISHVQKQSPAASQAYWDRYTENLEPCLFPKLANNNQHASDSRVGHLNRTLTGVPGLRVFCQLHELTLATVFQVAWGLVLRAYARSDDVCYGYMTSGRDAPIEGIEKAAGPFINLLVRRMNFCEGLSAISMLQQSQDEFAQCLAYQYWPLASITHRHRGDLFNSFMSVQSVMPNLLLPDSSLVFDEQEGQNATEYDLALHIEIGRDNVSLLLDYKQSLFTDSNAGFVVDAFEQAVQGIVDYSERPVKSIPVIGGKSLKAVREWNQKVPQSVDRCVSDMIFDNYRTNPDSPAVCAWDGSFTYSELEKHTANLSYRLSRHYGVGAEILVPICAIKSCWVTVAIIAVIRAGGAFILLDPGHPLSRLRAICTSCEATVILAPPQYRELASQLVSQVVTFGGELAAEGINEAHGGTDIPRGWTPDNALYGIFTSGSTGQPKGVIIHHRAFATSAISQVGTLGIGPHSRVLQSASFSFDVSVGEILTTLIQGGCLCIPSEEQCQGGLSRAACELQANWAILTPSVARTLRPNDFPTLRTLALIGEVVSSTEIQSWSQAVNLILTYGPAECTPWCTGTVERTTPGTDGRSLGRSFGCRIWLVDPQNPDLLVPFGAAGEIVIDGPIVGRGYLKDPSTTQAAFLDRPRTWGEEIPGRVYKTGDLARYNEDGTLQFVARKDFQVKLRGQRFELAEVEHHLGQVFGDAQDTFAEVTTTCHGAKLLVAFIYAPGPSAAAEEGKHALFGTVTAALRTTTEAAETQLGTRLPGYMVPTLFLPLQRIPLTRSGKLDRRQLREAVTNLSFDDLQAYFAPVAARTMPTTPVEKRLQEIWADVLNRPAETIGVTDSFFRLGGDSLGAMQVVSQTTAAGFSVTMQHIFRLKTILALSSLVSKSQPMFDNEESGGPHHFVPLSPGQQMLLGLARFGSGSFTQSVQLVLERFYSHSTVEQAIHQLVACHPMLDATFRRTGDDDWDQTFTTHHQSNVRFQYTKVESLDAIADVVQQGRAALDIEAGPVFSVDLVQIAEKSQHLFMVAHPLIMDRQSWKIILEDLQLGLTAGLTTKNPNTSFLTWCKRQSWCSQTESSVSDAFVAQETDYPIPLEYWGLQDLNNPYSNTLEAKLCLDRATTATLLGAANNAYRTKPDHLLQAALLRAFSVTFEDRSLPTVLAESHLRQSQTAHIDTNSAVGCFTSLLPLRIHGSDPHGILRQVKDRGREPGSSFGQSLPVELIFRFHEEITVLEEQERVFHPIGNVPEEHILRDTNVLERLALIEVTADLTQECLEVRFVYPQRAASNRPIGQWINRCAQELRRMARELPSRPPQPTLSDLPLVSWKYLDLDEFLHSTLPQIGLSATDVQEVYPCSPIQQGILLTQKREGDVYNIRFILVAESRSASSSVVVDKLASAWNDVVARHPMLRTCIVADSSRNGLDIQLVRQTIPDDVVTILPPCPDPLREVQNRPRAEFLPGRPPYNLTMCPSLDGRVIAALDISHVLIDGASLNILVRDLVNAYDSRLPSGVGPLYSAYMSYLQSLDLAASKEFWADYLRGSHPCLLPASKILPEIETSQERSFRTFEFDLSSHAKLQQLCADNDEFTLANVIHVAWGLVLQAYTGSDDVCFGYMTSGRDVAAVPGILDALGPFISILVCRMLLPRDADLGRVVRQVQQDFLKSADHQHLPFADIQGAAGLPNIGLFNTVLSFEKRGLASDVKHEGSIRLEATGVDGSSEFDLSVAVSAEEHRTGIMLGYWPSFLSDKQVAMIADTFQQAISQLTTGIGHRTVGQLDLLGEVGRAQIETWNHSLPPRIDCCMHDLISQRCAEHPHKQAVCSHDGEFTYEEMDTLASALASHLMREHSIGPGFFVPVYFEKSRWAIIAMLAITKAGAAFVLIDPTHPRQRVLEICSQTHAPLVVTSESRSHQAKGLASAVVVIGDSKTQWSAGDIVPLNNNSVSPDQPLYAVFTSGSTGKPKGAVVTHRSLCTTALSHIPHKGLDQSARVLQFSSFAFDSSISEILFTLLAGGCVCVMSDEERVGDLSGAIRRLDVNFASLTPSVARILDPLQIPGLKVLGLVGEATAPGDISRWKPWVRLMNMYGPAECSILTTIHAPVRNEHDPTNIGKSYGAVCWITTAEDPNRLAPVGAIGELIIEGDIVGAGYLNDKAKTQAAFISPPTWLCQLRAPGNPGRLYRTGDLVQYEPTDGTIRYIGRKDTQVKLRGQRIELGEIENHLRRAIRDTAIDVVAEVVELTKQPSSSALIAFIANPQIKADPGSMFGTADQSFRDTITATIAQLDLSLPVFMVPSVFVPLRCIPLTKTGKADRRVLREAVVSLPDARLADLTPPFADATKQPPTTPAECAFQRLFADLFRRDDVSTIGRNDHFFRLGGDSIRAMALIPGAREAGYTIAMADIFKNPRLCDLAQVARQTNHDTSASLAPFALISQSTDLVESAAVQCSVSPAQIEDIYPCTPVQEGLMALSTKSADSTNNYKVTFDYQLDSGVDLDRFRSAWNAVVAANPILRTRMVQSDRQPGTFQVVLADCPHFYQFEDPQTHRKHTGARKMDLGQELVDFSLVLPSGGPRQFHLTLHHALYDGWTISSLWDQVESSYQNPGRALVLRPFNRFIEYAEHQADAAAQYWQEEFSGLSAPVWPSLPSGRHVPVADSSLHRTINHVGWKDTSDYTATTFIHLAWALVMSCQTDSDDLVYGITLNGRSAPVIGIEETTGPTIATFPLRVQLGLDRDTVEDTLSSIQQQAAHRISFQHFGLQNIRCASTEANQACQFQCHLGIQSFSSSQPASKLVTELPSEHTDYAAFAEYAILLICHLDETSPSNIDVVMNYDQQIIPSITAKRLIGQFAHLLQQLPNNLGTPLNQLDLLSPDDRDQLLKWNQDIPPSFNVCLHDLVLTHAAAAPNSAAVSAWDGDFTYLQLQALSGQLACQLNRLGVQPGSLVPICFEKSKWTVITMLGVLRAGGACVPLDPGHPAQYMESIIHRANAKLVLASPQTQNLIPEHCNALVRTVPLEGLAAHGTVESWPQPKFADTAFVIFTSGSTGQPKGILMEHSNLCTSIRDHGPPMRINSSTRALHFASYAFDASIYELFSVLANGGCVCIPSDSDRLSNLAGFINDAHVNYAIFTPSILNRVLRPEQVPGLQTVTLGGEAVTQDVVDVWASHLTLINGYGPAEATICAAGVIDPGSWTAGTIGSVTGGVGWITMPSDVSRLAPVGAVGELLIEGPVVTRGYLADAERTAAAYIPSPAWLTRLRAGQTVGRLYRTGDLVQYTNDGGIRYIGRKDTQIKLRGQRVELSHVEHYVRLCFPEAAEIVAEIVLRDGMPTMVTFIAPPNLQDIDEKQPLFLKPSEMFQAQVQSATSRLRSLLPVYMVPAVFLQLGRVPRTNSDKLNRGELREQAARLSRDQLLAFSTRPEEKNAVSRRPRTARERLFQELWASVLDLSVDMIGVNDDFFNLGGDSITGMKLASLLRRRGLSLDLSNIFARPVLAEQSLHAKKFTDQTAVGSYYPGSLLGIKDLESFAARQLEKSSFLYSGSRPFQSSEVEDIFPITEFQHQFLGSGQISYQQLLLPVEIDLGRLEHSCRVLVRRHPMLRSVFLPYQDGYLQVVLRHLDFRVTRISCDEDLAPFIERLCEKDASNGVPWGTPYFQVFLVSRSPSESALLLRTSHAQYDGETLPLMLQDLISSYEGTPLEEAPPPFPLYLRYRQTQANTNAYQFWKQYLQDAEMTVLALSRPASAPDVDVVRMTDPRLIRLPTAPRGITVSSLVKAAWAIVLAQTTGHRDIVFGHLINGRDAPLADVHAISGPCVTISPLRITIPSSNEVLDFLRHVQTQYTRAMPYANIDFGAIRQNATSWDPTVSFDSLVTHHSGNWHSHLQLNGQECTYSPIVFGGSPYFHVVTMPFQDQLRVQLFGPSQRASSLDLKQLSDRFCSVLGDLDECRFPVCTVSLKEG